VTPGEHDIRRGIVSSDELWVYLWYGRHLGDITLIDQDGVVFTEEDYPHITLDRAFFKRK